MSKILILLLFTVFCLSKFSCLVAYFLKLQFYINVKSVCWFQTFFLCSFYEIMASSSFKSEAMALDDMAEFFSGQDGLKRRSFKKRRRRNRSNIFYLLESAGKISEESDTTDEALRDYMENIAAQNSDSDLESNMTKRLSSLRCQLNNLSNGCPDPYQHADKAESDSCSEINYQRKRRKRKRKLKKMCGNNNYPVSVTLQPSLLKVPPPLPLGQPQTALINANKHVILKAHRSQLNDDDFFGDIENGHTSSCGENLNHLSGRMARSVEHARHSWPLVQNMDICNDGESDSETMYENTHTPESSALSSSSEDEIFTNDEGQFGDDEHEESCYETDSQCGWLRGRSNSDDEDKKFHKLYRETLEYLKSKPFFVEDDQGLFGTFSV